MIDYIENKTKKNVLFLTRYGSYNYNLNTVDSDIDINVFVSDKDYFNYFDYINYDFCINDINYLFYGIYNQVPKFIDILFSDTLIINSHIDKKTQSLIDDLFCIKNEIAIMDLNLLYKTHYKEFIEHRKRYLKSNLLKLKSIYAIHSYRFIDILDRFNETDFSDYQYAIKYNDNDYSRDLLLYIKNNNMIPKEYEVSLLDKIKKVDRIKDRYNKRANINTIQKINILHKDISLEVD